MKIFPNFVAFSEYMNFTLCGRNQGCTLYRNVYFFKIERIGMKQKTESFSGKFQRLVLGLVGLVDAKGADVVQPI